MASANLPNSSIARDEEAIIAAGVYCLPFVDKHLMLDNDNKGSIQAELDSVQSIQPELDSVRCNVACLKPDTAAALRAVIEFQNTRTKLYTSINELYEQYQDGWVNLGVQAERVPFGRKAKEAFEGLDKANANLDDAIMKFKQLDPQMEAKVSTLLHGIAEAELQHFETDLENHNECNSSGSGASLDSGEELEAQAVQVRKSAAVKPATSKVCRCRQVSNHPAAKAAVASNKKCPNCNRNDHLLVHCQSFRSLSNKKKYSVVKKASFCYHCLAGAHRVRECKTNEGRKCGQDGCEHYHHRLLHLDQGLATDRDGEQRD